MEEEDTAVPVAAAVAQAQQQQQQQPPLMMETSLVQEESIDESNDASVQDLQVTLQEKIEMRKNLESTFDCQTLSILSSSSFPYSNSNNIINNMQRTMMSGTSTSASAGLSIQEKIFHFEQKVAANRAATTATAPGRPPLGPLLEGANGEIPVGTKKVPSKRLKVFLRLRPVQEGPSTIEVLPPSKAHNQQHQQQQMLAPNQQQQHASLLYSTKIRTHPPKTSNAAKVDRSLMRFGGGGMMGTSTAESVATAAANDAQVKEYEFTRVFGPEAPQQDVYTHTALPMVNQLCSGNTVGKSALLFCYGITNAGKTHTILGDPNASTKNDTMQNKKNNDSWGIVPRCLDGVLQKVHNTDLQVYVSFLEVYNEHIFDLLPHAAAAAAGPRNYHKRVGSSSSLASMASNASTVVAVAAANDHRNNTSSSLKIRERRGQIVVQGLANHHVTSLEQGLALIRRAKVGRHTATNNLNQKSSRSHCVCRLTVKLPASLGADDNNDDDDACSVGSHRSCGTAHSNYSNSGGGGDNNNNNEAHFWIVDLAGSERSKRTNMGRIRQQEAACINKSLMTLMRCLTTHSKNKPYRDSKLTVLFMRHWNTIGSQTSMIVNAHASIKDYDETQHVLGYAVSVKVVPTVTATAAAAMAAANTAVAAAAQPRPRVEYGYDGHRKKVGKQRSTIRKVAKILRKLSPVPKRNNNNNNNKRKNEVGVIINASSQLQQQMGPPLAVAAVLPLAPQPFARSLLEPEEQQQHLPAAKKVRRGENSKVAAPQEGDDKRGNQFNAISSAQYNRELTSLQMALSEARAKIQVLTSKVTGLEQQVEATETQVRAEVAEEMLNEMTAMRQRYEETITRLKELKKNHHATAPRQSLVERNQAMVEELQEKVEELEEDMERMAHHHEEELLSMQHEHAETLLLKDQEIGTLKSRLAEMEQLQQQQQSLVSAAAAAALDTTTMNGSDDDVESLQKQLAASRNEVHCLQRSKEELIATYEKLLAGDEDDDDNVQNDDDDDDSENDDDDDEVEGEPTPKVERTKHRATIVQMTTTTSSKNHLPTPNNDTDSSEDGDEDDEEEEEMNEPTPKVERNKNAVKKQQKEEGEEDDEPNDMPGKDACPTPSLPGRRRKPFGPVSGNNKQAVSSTVKKTVNSSLSSSPITDSSPTNTSSSSNSNIDIDDVSQKATIQEPSIEIVM